MAFTVRAFDDPGEVLAVAGAFLSSRPAEHTLLLTLLAGQVATPVPSRYWVVSSDDNAVGVALQSPIGFPADITPMPDRAVVVLVDAIAHTDAELPGVTGPANEAAIFAGHWSERRGAPAHPEEGARLYELGTLITPDAVGGQARPATADERDLVVEWARTMLAEGGGPYDDPARAIDRRLEIGSVWVWDDDGPRALATWTDPVAGMARIALVYTPPDFRRRGYSGGLVAAASGELVGRGLRCVLFTELANPTSNAIYQRLGYRAIQELLRYRFG